MLGHIARIIPARSRPFKPPGISMSVGTAVMPSSSNRRSALVTVAGFLHRVAMLFEDFPDGSSDEGFVVNDENDFVHCCK
jgi:hypothetical protein